VAPSSQAVADHQALSELEYGAILSTPILLEGGLLHGFAAALRSHIRGSPHVRSTRKQLVTPFPVAAESGQPRKSVMSPFPGPVRGLLSAWGVFLHLSPPRRPQYYGSIEAANGSLKTRTEHLAASAGRPGQWTSTDLAQARDQANALLRPWGPHGPTPQQLWLALFPLSLPGRGPG
jgi:hypothetical protein